MPRHHEHGGHLSEDKKADIATLLTAGIILALVIGLGYWLN
jgi:hypothetical protein